MFTRTINGPNGRIDGNIKEEKSSWSHRNIVLSLCVHIDYGFLIGGETRGAQRITEVPKCAQMANAQTHEQKLCFRHHCGPKTCETLNFANITILNFGHLCWQRGQSLKIGIFVSRFECRVYICGHFDIRMTENEERNVKFELFRVLSSGSYPR